MVGKWENPVKKARLVQRERLGKHCTIGILNTFFYQEDNERFEYEHI